MTDYGDDCLDDCLDGSEALFHCADNHVPGCPCLAGGDPEFRDAEDAS